MFFYKNILESYIGEYLCIKLKDNEKLNYFLLENFIKEDDKQPYTGQLLLKYKYNDTCIYTLTTDNIKEIYVYDVFNKKMKYLLVKIGYKYNLEKYLIHHIYQYLINGTIKLY